MLDLLEYSGVFLALLGAVLVSRHDGYSKWGFVVFLASCLLLTVWSFMMQKWGLLLMNVTYIFINTYGVYKWFAPRQNT
jgi:hypothetical protein